jgi:hypothetical protein
MRVRKIAKSYYEFRHVPPSFRTEQLGSHWTDFHEIWYFSIFRKNVENIQVLLKSDKNKGCFTWRPLTLLIISRSVLLRMRNVSDKSCRENQNTHFVLNKFFENRAVCEIMWTNTVERHIQQMTWRTRIACWINKATHTLTICNISCFSPVTVVARTRLLTLYLRCLSFSLSFNECSKQYSLLRHPVPTIAMLTLWNYGLELTWDVTCNLRSLANSGAHVSLSLTVTNAYRVLTKWLAQHFRCKVLVTLAKKRCILQPLHGWFAKANESNICNGGVCLTLYNPAARSLLP